MRCEIVKHTKKYVYNLLQKITFHHCQMWNDSRSVHHAFLQTHAPSLSESFIRSDTIGIKYRPITPVYCSASSACADSAVDSNPMIRCLSCGTTNNTKHPIVQRNFLPACQAVAIGPAANSMHAHVRLAVCQASSVPSARLRACYRNPICRLSGNPSVGVSS